MNLDVRGGGRTFHSLLCLALDVPTKIPQWQPWQTYQAFLLKPSLPYNELPLSSLAVPPITLYIHRGSSNQRVVEERRGLLLMIHCHLLSATVSQELLGSCSRMPHHHREERQSSAHRTPARPSSLDLDSWQTVTYPAASSSCPVCLTQPATRARSALDHEHLTSGSSRPTQLATLACQDRPLTPAHWDQLLTLAHPTTLVAKKLFLTAHLRILAALSNSRMASDTSHLATDVAHFAHHVPDSSSMALAKSLPAYLVSDSHPSWKMACHFLVWRASFRSGEDQSVLLDQTRKQIHDYGFCS